MLFACGLGWPMVGPGSQVLDGGLDPAWEGVLGNILGDVLGQYAQQVDDSQNCCHLCIFHMFIFTTTFFVHCRMARDFLFYKCGFLMEPVSLTALNGSLQNFNTWRVSAGNIKPGRDFWLSPPPLPQQKRGPKTTYFSLLQLTGNGHQPVTCIL